MKILNLLDVSAKRGLNPKRLPRDYSLFLLFTFLNPKEIKMTQRIQESTEEKRIWHNGPPPHIGWWNASVHECPMIWRFWTGEAWTNSITPRMICPDSVEGLGIRCGDWQARIKWNDYWPENARVPRIDPRISPHKDSSISPSPRQNPSDPL